MEAPFETNDFLFQHGQLLHYASLREEPDSLQVLEYIYNKNPAINALNVNKLLFTAVVGSLDCVRFLVEMVGGDPWGFWIRMGWMRWVWRVWGNDMVKPEGQHLGLRL